MGKIISRRLGATAIMLGVVAAAVVAVRPVGADTLTGDLQIKGVGSYFTEAPTVNLGVAPGKTVLFSVRVVNTGTQTTQYKVVLTGAAGDVTSKLYLGATLVPSGTFFTPLLAPGKNVVLTVKVTPAATSAQLTYVDTVSLSDPIDGTPFDSANLVSNVAAPAHGVLDSDLFLKTGTQPYVGSPVSGQVETAGAVKVGTTVTFNVRLQNDVDFTTITTLNATVDCSASWAVTFKAGTKNITAAVLGPGYQVIITNGTHVDLVLTVKLVAVQPCTANNVSMTASGILGTADAAANIVVAV